MDLPQLFSARNDETELLISIIIVDTKIQAALWHIGDSGATIREISSIHTYQDAGDAVVKADLALQELGKDSEHVNEVVFGLAPGWVSEKGVVDAKKPILKSIAEKLDLQAEGFIVTTESLLRYLVGDNPRLSALLVQFSQQTLVVNLIQQGRLTASQQVGRSGDTIADMTEALARLTAHTEQKVSLPPKIFIASFDLDRAELMEEQQHITEQDWANSHPFVQTPTIDVVERKQILLSLLTEHASGDNVSDVSFNTAVPVQSAQTRASGLQASPTDESSPPPVTEEPQQQEFAVEQSQLPPTQASKSFGVPVSMSQPVSTTEPVSEVKTEQTPPKGIGRVLSWFTYHKPFAIGGFIAGLLTLLLVGFIWATRTVQAEVVLDVQTKSVAKEVEITLDPDRSDSVPAELILAAETISQQVSGSKTIETTGTKLIGDKATGKVKIYNKSSARKTFEQGTQLSNGNLTFTLDDTVEVASASVQKSTDSESKEYGSAEATITAVEIGADSNLGQDTQLQIESFDTDTYSATVIEELTGGSSREVRVVAIDDREQLTQELRQELTAQANEELQQQTEDGQYVVPTNNITVDSSNFNAEVGDEVSTLTLDMTATVQALSYRADDLQPLAEVVLVDDLPDGYTLEGSEPQILSTPNKDASESGEVRLTANISAEAQPQLDLDQLRQQITGKKMQEAEQLLTDDEFVNSVEITFQPAVMGRLWPRLPVDPDKITVL